MANFNATGDLRFQATNVGGVLTPTTDFSYFGSVASVVDDNSDGDIDTGDYYISSSVGYTGYTIEINGHDYAIFFNGFSSYIVPFDASFDDLSVLDNTPVTQTITNTGNNAVVVNCFARGTQIKTPSGTTPVEELRIGDEILSHKGRRVPVRWIGRQTMSTRFRPAERLMPVRVKAGALGGGLPIQDLVLTADHALLIDGLLVNAGALVNGETIDYVPLGELGDSYTVYHVETENHDVILAEGVPAETFIDYVARRAFDNYAEYLDLYGEDRTIAEAPYPRISSARQVPEALRQKLRKPEAA